jgi:hypothetical protein
MKRQDRTARSSRRLVSEHPVSEHPVSEFRVSEFRVSEYCVTECGVFVSLEAAPAVGRDS